MRSMLWAVAAALPLVACDDADGGAAAADAETPVDAGADAAPPGDGCGDTPEALRGCADVARYAEDLEFVARERGPGSPHWQAVQDRCAEVFEGAGLTVERHDYGTGVNVVGVLPGVSRPEERVMVSAHYDHVPGCIGADDNASGTAGVLEAARVLAKRRYARTLVFVCWDEEERGLVGSSAYARRAKRGEEQIRAHFVFEMIGTRDERPGSQLLPDGFEFIFPDAWDQMEANEFRGDFIAVIGDDINPAAPASFVRHAEAVDLPSLRVEMPEAFRSAPEFGDFRRSDHAPFWDEGTPPCS